VQGCRHQHPAHRRRGARSQATPDGDGVDAADVHPPLGGRDVEARARLRSLARGAVGPAARNLLEDDAAAALAEPVAEQGERRPPGSELGRVAGRRHHLRDEVGVGLAGDALRLVVGEGDHSTSGLRVDQHAEVVEQVAVSGVGAAATALGALPDPLRVAWERLIANATDQSLADALHASGDGPLTIRIGGDSADQSLWDPLARRIPRWEFRLSRGWLEQTDALLDRVRLRLILDLNLVTGSPLRAATWARAALAGLRPGSIAAFEIGNEPDLYDRAYWLATIAHTGAVLPAAISPRSYLRAFAAYARALQGFAPAVPLMGPAVAKPERSIGYIRVLTVGARPGLGAITAHRYPYSACAVPGSGAFPTVARLLSRPAVTPSLLQI